MYLGIDVGTQSVKALLFDPDTSMVAAACSSPLALVSEEDGTREQRAEWWVTALKAAVTDLPAGLRQAVRGIGVSGQQHGFVALDAGGNVLAPVKLWCDTATTTECAEITANFGGADALIAEVGNPILPGYTASKILWLRKHRPEAYAALATVLLPHDYINFLLTGERAMEAGDASGTGLLNVYTRDWHEGALAGVYIGGSSGHPVRFRQVKAPSRNELTRLTHTIAHRVARYLERQGLLERDTGNIYLTPEAVDTSDEDPSNQLLGSSITYRIALGPQQGRKVLTLQTLPDCESENSFASTLGEVAGFSLHAGVATKANERTKLVRLCRYIARPAVSTKRLSLTRNGQLRYELKTPWRNGTTHVIFEPLDFISRLVSLVPKPRVNLTRFHGVFAPNSKYRSLVTPARRGKGNKSKATNETQDQTPAEKRGSITWAMRLKRVFGIDIA
jgi:hypothetical protein